ncbi:unnamed protein product, partial [Brenthis ino]
MNKDRVLHYKPLKCSRIILACCVLNNIVIKYGIVDDVDITALEHDDIQDHDERISTEREREILPLI